MRICLILAALTIGRIGTALALQDTGDVPAPEPTPDPTPAFVSVHQQELEAHRDTPTSPDLLGRPGEPILPLQSPRTARPCRTIFGYLPYWEGATNMHWNLITHIACFSVDVASDGSVSNAHSWPWTSVINSAHANGVKVILVATLFNDTSISTLINNATYKANFFANMKARMLQGSADGLNIDFEGSGTWRSTVQLFMADLTAYMHTQIPGSEVTFAGPALASGWDLAALANSCDGIFIMGYAFAGSWNTYTGPNSPLTASGSGICITNTVLSQYYPVTQVHPDKLILGLPYYGGHWTTGSSSPRAAVVSWVGATFFRNDQPNSQIYGRQWDTISQTPWYYYQDPNTWHQVWYDDAQSLGLKYQLAQDQNLQGVGMWALNYDGTRTELWNELQTRFVNGCCAAGDPNAEVAVFDDDFDGGTSASNWHLYTSSSDYTADFAFDYSTRGIPSAPNSQGATTIGVKFTVNKDPNTPAPEALSAYPIGVALTGDYALRFDMWLNYNGGAGGGSGSTEFMLAGLNQSGTRVVWPNNAASDGYSFAVDGEGGASDDYRAYAGPTEYAIGSGVYVPHRLDHTDALYKQLFTSPPFETLGAPGKQWVEVEVRQIGNKIEWRLDGVRLATITNPPVTTGTALLGYMDPYASIANPAADNFVVYDNVRVVLLPNSDCNANGVVDACETIAAGDFNADGHVDVADAAVLADVAAGPDLPPIPPSPTCTGITLAAFDFDHDGDVDLADAALFQRVFGG